MPSSTMPNGSFQRQGEDMGVDRLPLRRLEIAVMARPMLSFEVQRCIEATTVGRGDRGSVGELEAWAAE
jgi:hypothetical protein